MQLEHQFRVPVPVAQAWDVLLDVERIAPCMPGATVESFDGETIVGRVKVKVGPIQVTYSGTARFTDKDETARRAVIEASAKEARGSGTALATITTQLHDDGGSATNVTVTTDLAITGKPAQFGRGVMEEVGNKLLGRFADCLADTLGSGDATDSSTEAEAAAEPAPAATAPAAAAAAEESPAAAVAAATVETPTPAARPSPAPTPLRRPVEHEAIDLLDTAGLPVLKRAAPVLIGLVVFFLFWRLVRRR
jgi:carbon monoxide dehydrogenase subunit G